MEFKVYTANKPWYEKALVIPMILFGAGLITMLFATLIIPIIFVVMAIVGIVLSFIACRYAINFSSKLLYKGLNKCKIGK